MNFQVIIRPLVLTKRTFRIVKFGDLRSGQFYGNVVNIDIVDAVWLCTLYYKKGGSKVHKVTFALLKHNVTRGHLR